MNDIFDENELYALKIGEKYSCNEFSFRKVPGGWVYESYLDNNKPTCCFIPFIEQYLAKQESTTTKLPDFTIKIKSLKEHLDKRRESLVKNAVIITSCSECANYDIIQHDDERFILCKNDYHTSLGETDEEGFKYLFNDCPLRKHDNISNVEQEF